MMEIKSSLLGEQQVDPDTILIFPQGIPGFEQQTRFKLFHQQGNDVLYWLQALDDADLTFSVTHPATFNINYQFSLTDEEEKLLDLQENDNLLIMIMLHKEESGEQPTVKGSIKFPLIINERSRFGIQKALLEPEQSITLADKNSEIHITEK